LFKALGKEIYFSKQYGDNFTPLDEVDLDVFSICAGFDYKA
jgi:hypothetical protein